MSSLDLSARAARPADIQRRQTPFRDVTLRAAPDGTGGDALHFCGYACVTETGYAMSDAFGPYTEIVRRGAFAQTLAAGADVPLLVNHSGLTLARTKSGTMQLAEDDSGLYVDARLDPASPHVQALRSAMDRGDVDEMSFGFWIVRQQWSPDYDQRDIIEVDIHQGDVSIVNFGANPATAGAQLNARDLSARIAELPEDEQREVYERLSARFALSPPAPAVPSADLYRYRARALAL
ncbi:HK97 family phage prohead protease [Actinacidiphila acididurans]|uniref:HK97 family phage prohead protease n=1 Tax=Actinacidiphila acididurans TaxID=2784346 RepID=A0ABS2TNE5_9ACTN|nr:HK97 family phage prohead protease [Actinacidiphila acididurans]MBM9504526.1 HK97 family phage prohead protease [Actinacidiphila acididurans]